MSEQGLDGQSVNGQSVDGQSVNGQGVDALGPHPVAGQGVVVTGAGNGIGAAIARRLSAEGARLVLNDLDGPAVQAVAEELGALAVVGDAASENGVAELVAAATAHLGRIDVFFANAGVAATGGVEAPESAWDLSWQVNVMSHVRTARALVPGWVESGGGRLVVTASAAGLLTMIGSAPYSVTKHAAVAHAEWLAVTYGDSGVVVQALCPQGVRTNMMANSGKSGNAVLAPAAIEPEVVADVVADALRGEELLILPHPEIGGYHASKAADPDRWIRGMRRLQAKVRAAVAAGGR